MYLFLKFDKIATNSFTFFCISAIAACVFNNSARANTYDYQQKSDPNLERQLASSKIQQNSASIWLVSNTSVSDVVIKSASTSQSNNAGKLGFLSLTVVGIATVSIKRNIEKSILKKEKYFKCLEERINDIEIRTSIKANQNANNSDEHLQSLQNKIDSLKRSFNLQNQQSANNYNEHVQSLQRKIDSVERLLSRQIQQSTNKSDEHLQSLQKKIYFVESSLSMQTQQSTSNLYEHVQSLQRKIDDVESYFNLQMQSENNSDEYVQSLQNKIDDVESLLSIQTQQSVSKHDEHVQSLQKKIDDVESSFNLQIEQSVNNSDEYLQSLQRKIGEIENIVSIQTQQIIIQCEEKIQDIAVKIGDRCLINESLSTDVDAKNLSFEGASRQDIREANDILLNLLSEHADETRCQYRQNREEINNLRSQIEKCLRAYSTLQGHPTLERFDNISQVLGVAQEEFHNLMIFNSAFKSANRANFNDPQKVYSVLRIIARIGNRYFQNSSLSLGNFIREEFKSEGFVDIYRPGESEATRQQYRNERRFRNGNSYIYIYRHLTLRSNNLYLQIYFDFDRDSERVNIGYCGNHLSTVSHNT